VCCETVMSGRCVNTDVSDDIIAVIFMVEVIRDGADGGYRKTLQGICQLDGWV